MRRALPPLLSRRIVEASSHIPRQPRPPPVDLRQLRDTHVAESRKRIFGPQGSMPGDRYLRKNLEGRKLMKWYFPSKYNLQDFRVDDYHEMQAERYDDRPIHPAVPALGKSLANISKHREELRAFFKRIDEATFLASPTIQDLYGFFRMFDPDRAVTFDIPERVFREHTPLFTEGSPFHAENCNSLEALMLLIEGRLHKDDSSTLRARVMQLQDEDTVRDVLLEEKDKLNLVPDFTNMIMPAPTGSSAEDSAAAVSMRVYAGRRRPGNPTETPAKAKREAEKALQKARDKGPRHVREYLAIRHRFVDPMYRRRRLKWMERQTTGKNGPTEVKHNSYYAAHPDKQKDWPTNKGSVTVTWPSPYH